MLSINERKLILRWNNEDKNQQDIADLIGCSQSAVSRFLMKFHKKGTIQNLPRSGRPTKLKGETLERVKKSILKRIKSANTEYNSVNTKQLGEIIRREIGETYSMRHVERIMHKLGFSLITPRPQHLRHDQEKVDAFRDEFKKNSHKSMWIMKLSPSTK